MNRCAASPPAERCRENPRDRSPASADGEGDGNGVPRAVVGLAFLCHSGGRERGEEAARDRLGDHEGRQRAGFSDGPPLRGVGKE